MDGSGGGCWLEGVGARIVVFQAGVVAALVSEQTCSAGFRRLLIFAEASGANDLSYG